MDNNRGNFGSKIGVVLATAGSAVGLGNVWRFPYMVGEDGGAAFILLYIGCLLLLGLPGMIAEFIVGRNGQANSPRAYSIAGRHKAWGAVGFTGILAGTIILGFYAVVAGWCLHYLGQSIIGNVVAEPNEVSERFTSFISNPWQPCVMAITFILVTHIVIVRGVRKGIEKASNTLMPMLFVLLIVLVVCSCSLDGASAGIKFLFNPDFSKITANVFLDALGQAFFSLSLGVACLCTYSSYFNHEINLFKAAGQICIIDTVIAILAGLMIFPAAFAVGVQPDSGPTLIFITLPNVFRLAFASVPWLGYVIAILFYMLMCMAALTSTISMHEIGTALFTEELKLRRRWSAWIVTTICIAICIVCSLSMVESRGLSIMGLSAFDFCDKLTANYMMPIGAFFTCICVGWMADKKMVEVQLSTGGNSVWLIKMLIFMFRFVCPIGILLVLLHQWQVI